MVQSPGPWPQIVNKPMKPEAHDIGEYMEHVPHSVRYVVQE